MEFKYLKIANILYVEDDDSIREGYKRTLQRCAKELFIASDGEEGFELFKKNQNSIDIVITDIKMPKLNGIDMVNKIKELSKHTPIIFTSAHSDSSFLFEALDIQADGYLLKPVPIKKLMAIIDKISKNIHLEELNKKHEKIIHQMEKMSAIGEMIGNIAHQWRQPLSIISTLASGLKLSYEIEESVSNDNTINTLDNIVIETKKLSSIIDDFRDFFKGEQLKKVEFKLKDICSNMDCILLDNLGEEITIVQEIDENVSICGNQNLLIQVFINIINNALYALDKDTKEKKLLFITVERGEIGDTLIKIKDSAGGIPEEIIDKIFEPYFTTKHKAIGTGLGLFITYQIITKQFSGDILVENASFEYEGVEYCGAQFMVHI